MPAITKDPIQQLREAAQELLDEYQLTINSAYCQVPESEDVTAKIIAALAATEHITDTAATQAAEKPQDGLVNPPSRAEPAAPSSPADQWLFDLVAEHEVRGSGLWGCASFDAIGVLNLCRGIEAELTARFRAAGRNAQPDSTPDLTPTDLSAVEVPTLAPSSPDEVAAFEAWAEAKKYDMTTHPLHWLFLNEKTYAARQGWKAALEFARASMKGTTP